MILIDVNQLPVVTRQPSILSRTRQDLADMDVFNAQIENSVWATRIYFVLLFTVVIILIVFTALSHQTQSNTVQLPSESTFQTLYEEHSTHSLSCPCSQSSIQYNTFLSIYQSTIIKYVQVILFPLIGGH